MLSEAIEWLWDGLIGEAGGPRSVSFEIIARVSPAAAPAGQLVQIVIDGWARTLGGASSPHASVTLVAIGPAP